MTQLKVKNGYLTAKMGDVIIKRLDLSFRLTNVLCTIASIKDAQKRGKALIEIGKSIRLHNRQILQGKFCDQIPISMPFFNFWYKI